MSGAAEPDPRIPGAYKPTEERDATARRCAYDRLAAGVRVDQTFRDTIWWAGLLALIGAAAGWLTRGPHAVTDAFWATLAADGLLLALIRATLAKSGSIVSAACRLRSLEAADEALPALELETQSASRWIRLPEPLRRRLGLGPFVRVGQSQTYAWYYAIAGLGVGCYWLVTALDRDESPLHNTAVAAATAIVAWNAFRLALSGAEHDEGGAGPAPSHQLRFRTLFWPFHEFSPTGGVVADTGDPGAVDRPNETESGPEGGGRAER